MPATALTQSPATPRSTDGFFGPRPALGPPPRRPYPAPRALNPERRAAVQRGAQAALAEEEALAAREGPAAAVSPEQRLVQRITLGATQYELARIAELGYAGYLSEQLAYETLDDRELENVLHQYLPSLSMSAAEIYATYTDERLYEPAWELMVATLYRSLYSPRQLFESMVIFWTDHFSIDINSDTGYFLKPVDHRDVVRAHALRSFPELLWASAHSPAMLTYLTNDTNVAGHPNENYARELMELHTLGADNGYTQFDVREVARCFTGWTVNWSGGPELGEFYFDASVHDGGEKVVLGHTIPAGGGVEDGEAVLDILAHHPATARFISRKLLRYFWGYEPPQRYIDRLARAYRRTGGDLRTLLRIALQRDWMAVATPKLKRPYRLMVSALRALFATVNDPLFVLYALLGAGHFPFSWAPPNGYPDSRGYWGGFLLPRWNFGATVIDESISGAGIDLSFLDPRYSPRALTNLIDWLLGNGAFSEATRQQLIRFLRAGRSPRRIREAVGLALSSPEFQDY